MSDRTNSSRFRPYMPFTLLLFIPAVLLWRSLLLGEVFLPADLLKDIAPWRQWNTVATPWNPLMWDGIAQLYPWRYFAASTLNSGYLPFWNPHQFCGTPFLANSQSAIFYPFNLLYAVIPTAYAFGVFDWLHLSLTGIFLFLFLRKSLNLSVTGSLAGAIAWQCCTWQVAWLPLPTFLSVSTWIPLALLLIDRIVKRTTLHNAALLGLVLGLMLLAGHLQIALYGVLLLTTYAIFRLIPPLRDKSININQLLQAILVVASIAGLMSAAQLLPSMELSKVSHRAIAGPLSWSMYQGYLRLALMPQELVNIVSPMHFGNPTLGTYWGYTNFAETACYISLTGFWLAMAGIMLTWKTSRETRFYAVTGVIVLLAAIGTPVDAILYFGIPGFAQSGSPGRILVIWSLMASILAGIGFDKVVSYIPKVLVEKDGAASDGTDQFKTLILKPALVAVTLFLLLVIVAVGILVAQFGAGGLTTRMLIEPAMWLIPLAVLIVLTGIVLSYRSGGVSNKGFANVLVTLIALDLLTVGLSYSRFTPIDNVYPITPALMFLQKHAGTERVMPVNKSWSLDPANPPKAVLPPNGATVYGLNDTQGYDSLFPGQYMAFAAKVDGDSPTPVANGNIVFTRGRGSDEAKALSPRYYLIRENDTLFPLNGLDLVLVDHGSRLYVDKNALPRFTAPWAQDSVKCDASIPTRLKFEVAPPSTQTDMVIRDQWYPGWKATVNGKQTEIKEAPYIFRTVPVSPGTSTTTIEMRFQPSTIYFGIYCLCMGLVVFTVVLTTGKKLTSPSKA